ERAVHPSSRNKQFSPSTPIWQGNPNLRQVNPPWRELKRRAHRRRNSKPGGDAVGGGGAAAEVDPQSGAGLSAPRRTRPLRPRRGLQGVPRKLFAAATSRAATAKRQDEPASNFVPWPRNIRLNVTSSRSPTSRRTCPRRARSLARSASRAA